MASLHDSAQTSSDFFLQFHLIRGKHGSGLRNSLFSIRFLKMPNLEALSLTCQLILEGSLSLPSNPIQSPLNILAEAASPVPRASDKQHHQNQNQTMLPPLQERQEPRWVDTLCRPLHTSDTGPRPVSPNKTILKIRRPSVNQIHMDKPDHKIPILEEQSAKPDYTPSSGSSFPQPIRSTSTGYPLQRPLGDLTAKYNNLVTCSAGAESMARREVCDLTMRKTETQNHVSFGLGERVVSFSNDKENRPPHHTTHKVGGMLRTYRLITDRLQDLPWLLDLSVLC